MVVQRKNCGKHQHNAIGKLIRDLNLTQADHLWRRKWEPTPVFLPGESYGQRNLAGCSPWGYKSQTRLSDFDYFTKLNTLASDWFSEAKRIISAVWSWSELNSASCLLCQPWLLPEKGWLSHPCPPPPPPHGGGIPGQIDLLKVKSLSRVRLFATPWTVAHQAPLSMGFSRQEYCSGLLFPSPGDLPDPGIKPGSPSS